MIVWLEIRLSTEQFEKVVDHIANSMFFGVKRLAPNLRHVVFHSIGDHMHDDNQIIEDADIYIEKKISDKNIDSKSLATIISDKNWNLKFTDLDRSLNVIIDKITGMITYRKLLKYE